ncbi:hypothetical protein SMD11_5941 [Streptomyces albireticuli]|uniref:Uncharacterized protein n=1 Tax=Streptomyces albireticuli TaxID=1940 RepID=A0A1Z2LB36_9ACTN|nr:hypothetical protein SMD11_5941 [Streptomyces albireticuli]
MTQPQQMPARLRQIRADRSGNFHLGLQQFRLNLPLVDDRLQVHRRTDLFCHRYGQRGGRVEQKILLLDP